jgi:hypothetical protein
MKKVLLSLLFVISFIAVNCSKDEVSGPSSLTPAVNDVTIDLSHNGTGGYTFGAHGADQVKRFQTFKADNACLNITGIDVRIRKNDSTAAYQNVTVELYETTGNVPTNLLAVSSINIESLGGSFTVMHASLKYYGLTAGNKYAIVLGQSNVQGNTNSGYEWCTKLLDTTQQFGKYSGTAWTDESGLGDAWMKIYTNKTGGTNEYSFAPMTQAVFFDDFQRSTSSVGNRWINYQFAGEIPIDTSSCRIINDGDGNRVLCSEKPTSIANGDTNWTDYTLFLKMKIKASGNPVAIHLRTMDMQDTYDVTVNGSSLYLQKYVSGYTTLATTTISYNYNEWVNLKISVSGINIKVYWNDSATPNFDYSDSSVPRGRICFVFFGSSSEQVLCDDVLVTIP